jgi:predicted ester cyclase
MGNMAGVPDLFAPNFVFHNGVNDIKGPEGMKQHFTLMRTAFPDYHETIEHIFAEGDLVAVFYTVQGTFKSEIMGMNFRGEAMGMKPTGKQFSMPYAILARFENGKQVESSPYSDMLSWYKQMGVPLPQG